MIFHHGVQGVLKLLIVNSKIRISDLSPAKESDSKNQLTQKYPNVSEEQSTPEKLFDDATPVPNDVVSAQEGSMDVQSTNDLLSTLEEQDKKCSHDELSPEQLTPDQITDKPDGVVSTPDKSTDKGDDVLSAPDQSTDKSCDVLSTPDQSTKKPDGVVSTPDQSPDKCDDVLSTPDQSTDKPGGIVSTPDQSTDKHDVLSTPDQLRV